MYTKFNSTVVKFNITILKPYDLTWDTIGGSFVDILYVYSFTFLGLKVILFFKFILFESFIISFPHHF